MLVVIGCIAKERKLDEREVLTWLEQKLGKRERDPPLPRWQVGCLEYELIVDETQHGKSNSFEKGMTLLHCP